MKMRLAVYTAQEGYSWQPGTSLGLETLKAYKARIGKFPSPDAPDFPFGGVFLEGDDVVFYRYHVAKKIDFRGRDALYCVLGAVPKAEAARLDVKALFALPQFAEVAKPFPTEAEVAPTLTGAAPDWLRNLEEMTLDVKISGSLENLRFDVIQKPVRPTEPPVRARPVPAEPREKVAAADGGRCMNHAAEPVAASCEPPQRPETPAAPVRNPWYLERRTIVTGGIILGAVSLLAALVLLIVCFVCRGGPKPPTGDDSSFGILTNATPSEKIRPREPSVSEAPPEPVAAPEPKTIAAPEPKTNVVPKVEVRPKEANVAPPPMPPAKPGVQGKPAPKPGGNNA